MKVTKVLSIVVLLLTMVSCGKPVGELVGASTGPSILPVNLVKDDFVL